MCLDMICDRASVSMMCLVLSNVYPILEMPLILCFLLDFGAHFLQFMANAITKNTSHINVSDPNENWIVKLYYGNKVFFVIMACEAGDCTVCLGSDEDD
jgi:phosphatidylglycerophosphate synthase